MANTELSDITNYLAIAPHLGTAGQPTAKQFKAVADAGYAVVINLALSTSGHALPNEAELVKSLGMSHFHLPVVWDAPSQGDLAIFCRLMDRNRHLKVFVHCALNMRVSVFVYLYRVLHLRESEPTAYADLHRIWQPNPTWQAFIDQTLD